MKHDLYKTGDADAPHAIKDRNGDVVLDLCRNCGKGEVELVGLECSGATDTPSKAETDAFMITLKSDLKQAGIKTISLHELQALLGRTPGEGLFDEVVEGGRL